MRKVFLCIGLVIAMLPYGLLGEEQTFQLSPFQNNRVSFYVLPEDSDIQSIFQPLIDSNQLEFIFEGVTENSFTLIEDNWVNEIGDIDPRYGYLIWVNTEAVITIDGLLVELPLELSLSTEPSLIGYPMNVPQSIEYVFASLLDYNLIQLIENSYGQFYLPEQGVNTIGDLQPGEAYTITLNEASTFMFCSPGTVCDCEVGDVNGDGAIDILDFSWLMNLIYADADMTPEILCSSDIDLDGIITVADVTSILYIYFFGLLPEEGLPVEILSNNIEIPLNYDEFTITISFDNPEAVNSFDFELYFDSIDINDLEIIDTSFDEGILEHDDNFRFIRDLYPMNPGDLPGEMDDITVTIGFPTPFIPTNYCFRNGAAFGPNGHYLDMTGDCSNINLEFNPDYSGPIWNVSPIGSDVGDGTTYHPFFSIQHAINQSVDGDTVLVQPGTYFENIDFIGKNIFVGSFHYTTNDTSYVSQTIIDGNASGSVVSFQTNEPHSTKLSGFTIRNGLPENFGGGIYINDASPTIENCIIKNNYAASSCEFDGNGLGGGIALFNSNAIVKSSVIINNETCGGWGNNGSGGGLYINESELLLDHLIIAHNQTGMGGAICAIQSDIQIVHCTFSDNNAATQWSEYGDEIYSNESTIMVQNSIIWGTNDGDIILDDFSGPSELIISYSDIRGGEPGILIENGGLLNWLDGNINQDPLFVNPDENDYLLTVDSPCINAGNPDSPLDPDGTITDMGAYSFPLNLEPNNGPIFYIAQDGDDSNNGFFEFPFASINHGIEVASEGDIIIVAPGTYYENINYENKNLTITSYQIFDGNNDYINQTTINGGGESCVVVFSAGDYDDAILNGFTITNGAAQSISFGGGISCFIGANPTLSNLIISDNQNGGMELYNASPILENVKIVNNSAAYGGGINIRHESNPILENVLIADNSATTYGGGLRIEQESHPFLNHVTITNNSCDDGGGILLYNSDITMTNSIVQNNDGENFLQGGSLNVSWSNISFDTEGEGNINTDPIFFDPENSDYHLQSDSPCIDAGDPESPLDPDGTITDMGAFYYPQNTEENPVYFDDILNGQLDDYLNFADTTGLSVESTIIINSIEDADIGDEIGLLDYNGILNFGDCSDEQGEILVGAGVWQGEPLEITTYGSMDFCDDEENEYGQYPGWVEGNTVEILFWRAAEDQVYAGNYDGELGLLIWAPIDQTIPELIPVSLTTYDVNGDNSTDVLDIVLVVNYILGNAVLSDGQKISADTNDDGIVDVLDIVIIIDYILEN
jgi:hypothetical protein